MKADHVLNRINAAAAAHGGRAAPACDDDANQQARDLQMEMIHLALDVCRLPHDERKGLQSIILHNLMPPASDGVSGVDRHQDLKHLPCEREVQ